MRIVIVIALVAFSLLGCKNKLGKNKAFDESLVIEYSDPSFTATKNIEGRELRVSYPVNPSVLISYGSKLILNSIDPKDYLLQIIDKEDSSYYHESIPYGEGPDELYSVFSAYIDGDSVIVLFDPYESTVATVQLDSLLASSAPVFDQKIKLDKSSQMKALLLPDNRVVTVSTVYDPPKRFHLFDSTGKYIHSEEEYPSYQFDFDSVGLAQANWTSLCISPNYENIAAAYLSLDLLELFNVSGDISSYLKIHGPGEQVPHFESRYLDGGGHMLLPQKDRTRNYYVSIDCNNEEIWVLYSGKLEYDTNYPNDPLRKHQDKVIVFDWNGNQKAIYQLDIPLWGVMTVDFETRKIYGINRQQDPKIIVYEY